MRLLSRIASNLFVAMSIRSSSARTISAFRFDAASFQVPILYQDDKLIVINKPPGMMSVPGKEVLTLMNVRPRTEQWRNALQSLLEDGVDGPVQPVGTKRPLSCIINSEDLEPAHKVIRMLLEKGENVPRKEDRFLRYLQRAFRIEDEELKMKVFRAAVARDDEMHRITIDTIPGHLLSASDVASHVADEYVRNPVNIIPEGCVHPGSNDIIANEDTVDSTASNEMLPIDNTTRKKGLKVEKEKEKERTVQQQKVHHVHRLDMETSGVLMFAKDEHTSAIIDAQFRDREVNILLFTINCRENTHFPLLGPKDFVVRCCADDISCANAVVTQVSKMYVARILGRPQHTTFTVSCPIKPDLRIRPYQVVDATNGKPSVTECQLIEENSEAGRLYASLFPESLVGTDSTGKRLTSSLVELKPLSGRCVF